MSYKFNPFTGQLDYYQKGVSGETTQTAPIISGKAILVGPGRIILQSESGLQDDLVQIEGLNDLDKVCLMADYENANIIYVRKSTYIKLPSDLRLSGYRTVTLMCIGDGICVGISDMSNI